MNLLSCLQSFINVANCQSFSIAARKMHVSPSKLSKEISWLEHKLGTQLFIRSTRQLSLTEHGNLLYDKAVKLFNEVEDLKDIVKPQDRELEGKLRIYLSVTPAIPYLTALCVDFMAKHSKIEFAVSVAGELITPGDNVFDLAISSDEINHPKYVSKRLFSVRYGIYGSPDYFKNHHLPQNPDQLIHHNCLINNLYGLQNKWTLGKKMVQVGGNFQSNNDMVLKDAAIKGLGLIWVPSFTVENEVNQGKLHPVLIEEHFPEILLYYIIPKSMVESKSLQALVAFFQHHAPENNSANS